jgi:ferredoxin
MGRTILLFLCVLALGAHHLRAGEPGLVLFWLSVPIVALVRRSFTPYVIALTCLAGAGVWSHAAWSVAALRMSIGIPYARATTVLVVVGSLCVLCSWLWIRRRVRDEYGVAGEPLVAPLVAGLVAAGVLTAVLTVVPVQAILLERFWRGAGWLHVLWLGVWAAWLTRTVLVPRRARRWRPRAWLLFSVLFYGQLAVGLLGVERFLMTGDLHLPIPAIIAAGPVYRGGGFFMPILFGVSVLFVGPAWCSWLCYLGGWDNLAALRQRWAGRLPRWRGRLRLGVLAGVVAVALLLNLAGVRGAVAAALGGLFGLVGVGVMATLSRQRGVMVHCTAYCPIGWLATRLGKLNPFRIVIDDSCTDCMACTRFCRFDALSPAQIEARRVGEACTLCGDCVTVCQKTKDIHYAFPGLSPDRARTVFLVTAVAMHAIFTGIAMI